MLTKKVIFQPSGLSGRFAAGTTLFQAAEQMGLELRSDCGQRGQCGKCRVHLELPGSPPTANEVERRTLTRDEVESHWRLACQAPVEEAVVATIPSGSMAPATSVGKEGLQGRFPVHPAVTRHYLSAAGKKRLAGIKSLEDIVVHTVEEDTITPLTPGVLRKLGRLDSDQGMTVVRHSDRGVIKLLPGKHGDSLGLAIDIGTTTIGAYICDFSTGNVLVSRAVVNPQRSHGEDVISRIHHITEDTMSLDTLQTAAAEAIEGLVIRCLAVSGHEIEAIDEIVVVGNTVMQHILAGLDPRSIGVSPYLPVTRAPLSTVGARLGLSCLSDVPAYVFPVISGFLGGDILACWLAMLFSSSDQTILLIDIGTNGELLLSSEKGVWATSCATGPALEGAMISCGTRASTGAIAKVSYQTEQQQLSYRTIGGGPPRGICGSGIIDLLAALRQAGVVHADGTLNGAANGVICDERGAPRKYLIPDSEITLTLKDVRQVQLAKAALRVGIDALLEESGGAEVDRVILTGAFGAGFDWEKARDIGMLPENVCRGKVESHAHLAGIGGIRALLDYANRQLVVDVARKICPVDLVGLDDFTTRFARATRFP